MNEMASIKQESAVHCQVEKPRALVDAFCDSCSVPATVAAAKRWQAAEHEEGASSELCACLASSLCPLDSIFDPLWETVMTRVPACPVSLCSEHVERQHARGGGLPPGARGSALRFGLTKDKPSIQQLLDYHGRGEATCGHVKRDQELLVRPNELVYVAQIGEDGFLPGQFGVRARRALAPGELVPLVGEIREMHDDNDDMNEGGHGGGGVAGVDTHADADADPRELSDGRAVNLESDTRLMRRHMQQPLLLSDSAHRWALFPHPRCAASYVNDPTFSGCHDSSSGADADADADADGQGCAASQRTGKGRLNVRLLPLYDKQGVPHVFLEVLEGVTIQEGEWLGCAYGFEYWNNWWPTCKQGRARPSCDPLLAHRLHFGLRGTSLDHPVLVDVDVNNVSAGAGAGADRRAAVHAVAVSTPPAAARRRMLPKCKADHGIGRRTYRSTRKRKKPKTPAAQNAATVPHHMMSASATAGQQSTTGSDSQRAEELRAAAGGSHTGSRGKLLPTPQQRVRTVPKHAAKLGYGKRTWRSGRTRKQHKAVVLRAPGQEQPMESPPAAAAAAVAMAAAQGAASVRRNALPKCKSDHGIGLSTYRCNRKRKRSKAPLPNAAAVTVATLSQPAAKPAGVSGAIASDAQGGSSANDCRRVCEQARLQEREAFISWLTTQGYSVIAEEYRAKLTEEYRAKLTESMQRA